MEGGITNSSGNKFGERCCNATYKGQIKCARDGCSAKVHRMCTLDWLGKAKMPTDNGPIYCPAHHIQRGDYIRQYYRNRRTPIPPDVRAQLADNPSNADTSDINASVHCSFCFDMIVLNDRRYFTRTRCNHTFHIPCLDKWMRTKVRFLISFLQR
jgi:hypothetical protein